MVSRSLCRNEIALAKCFLNAVSEILEISSAQIAVRIQKKFLSWLKEMV
jgi:hypothetical protein